MNDQYDNNVVNTEDEELLEFQRRSEAIFADEPVLKSSKDDGSKKHIKRNKFYAYAKQNKAFLLISGFLMLLMLCLAIIMFATPKTNIQRELNSFIKDVKYFTSEYTVSNVVVEGPLTIMDEPFITTTMDKYGTCVKTQTDHGERIEYNITRDGVLYQIVYENGQVVTTDGQAVFIQEYEQPERLQLSNISSLKYNKDLDSHTISLDDFAAIYSQIMTGYIAEDAARELFGDGAEDRMTVLVESPHKKQFSFRLLLNESQEVIYELLVQSSNNSMSININANDMMSIDINLKKEKKHVGYGTLSIKTNAFVETSAQATFDIEWNQTDKVLTSEVEQYIQDFRSDKHNLAQIKYHTISLTNASCDYVYVYDDEFGLYVVLKGSYLTVNGKRDFSYHTSQVDPPDVDTICKLECSNNEWYVVRHATNESK